MPEDKRTKLGPMGPARAVAPSPTPAPAVSSPTTPSTTPAPITGSPASGPTGPGATSYLPDRTDPLLGQVLADRYLLQKKLGEGGMGAVYLATHTVLEKQVALKILHGEFARKTDLVERFMQEARAASRIRHENVIDISDFGTTPDGMVFFAMELLKGRDLHEEIARARLAGQLLPWQRSKKIFLQICAALTAAHALGIIHRDLKPENIYLVEFLGDPDFVKLLDFGIAKLTEVAEGERKLTRTGMLFGTPEYMSPEQARGDNVDERVDVYAMGCILFQLVTGRVPFEAENFMGVLSLHLTQPPPVIPLDVFDSIGAPRALAQVIDKALAKDRNQRYPKVDELARAVRLASGDKPTGPVVAQANVAAPSSTATLGRVKTQWTGNLSVPEMEVAAPPPKSRLSLYIGAAILIGGTAAAAAMLVGRGGGGQAPSGGSAGSQVQAAPAPGPGPAPAAGSAATPPPPVPSPPVPPPPSNAPLAFDRAQIRLDSAPRGAEIKDLSSGKVIGKTPLSFGLTASRAPRQFALHHRDYVDAVVEVIPDRERIEYTEKLERGSATAPVVHQADPTRPPSARPDPTRPPGQVPSSGSPGPSGTPGAGSDVPEIKPAPPAGRPETAPPRPPAPGDDDSIQLKPDPTRLGNGSGQGSGSGSP